MPTVNPVIRGVALTLAHVPHLVRHGSKPSREIAKDPGLLASVVQHQRAYADAQAYAPNQCFIGNVYPDDLRTLPEPWFENPLPGAQRWGAHGEIMPEEELYGLLKICDEFDLIALERDFVKRARAALRAHPLFTTADLKRLGEGVAMERIEGRLAEGAALPLHVAGERLVGCIRRGHEEDSELSPGILLENLAARATGVLALRHLFHRLPGVPPERVEYLLGCGEEAVGDRYNRGGGSLSKAIGELAGCRRASGADVKAFCCGPVHATVIAGSLVAAGLYPEVAVVGGGSLAKLGMKFRGHLSHDMPILEDVLASFALLVGEDDGASPVLRLDSVGKHDIGSGSAQQAILQKLVVEPLQRLGMRLTDVEKYATELHNPEVTLPAGSGNVPENNYRMIAGLAVMRKEIERSELAALAESRGMPGFAPTQGHVASAMPFLGHALDRMREGRLSNAMFLAKGSLFLGRMTQLADGMSFLLERNPGRPSP